jgi:hypothetical protein
VIPREWFLVPLFVVNEVVDRIKDGTITGYSGLVSRASVDPPIPNTIAAARKSAGLCQFPTSLTRCEPFCGFPCSLNEQLRDRAHGAVLQCNNSVR